MTRCAVIVGVSEKSGYIQKSLADFYRFLLSLKGGSWTESEIMIIPEGIDLDSLKFLLRRVSDVKLRSLVFYFCGNKDDVRTENGFTFCGDEIKLQYIEENALHTAVFFLILVEAWFRRITKILCRKNFLCRIQMVKMMLCVTLRPADFYVKMCLKKQTALLSSVDARLARNLCFWKMGVAFTRLLLSNH